MEEIKKITYQDIEKANKIIKLLTISRKNKDTGKIEKKGYAEVHQRIKAFRMVYPQGDIETTILTDENGICKIRADIYDDNNRHLSSATAQENIKSNSFINTYNAIENCETSAVGRALGFAGFGIDTSIASAEEVQNAIIKQDKKDDITPQNFQEELMIQECQRQQIRTEIDETTIKNYLKEKGKSKLSDLTFKEAFDLLKKDDKEKEEVF
jgi:hypothetical protein